MSDHPKPTTSVLDTAMTSTLSNLPANGWFVGPSLSTNRHPHGPHGSWDPFGDPFHPRASGGTFDARSPFELPCVDPRAPISRINPSPSATTKQQPPPSTLPPLTLGSQTSPPFGQRQTAFRLLPEENTAGVRRQSQDSFGLHQEAVPNRDYSEPEPETATRRPADSVRSEPRYQTRRRPYNQDEFDGPSQLLPLPVPHQEHIRSQNLPQQPVNLSLEEQEEILRRTNDSLAQCAYHFIAKYQFPIPIERDKTRVQVPSDREWTEWAYLLKRLATKRRIPARVLYDNQIKQLVTTLENSITIRQSTGNTRSDQTQPTRVRRDDRYILQLISSGIQVAKLLMDSLAMQQLHDLYNMAETVILERRRNS